MRAALMNTVTADRLRYLLTYEPVTGVFIRRVQLGRWKVGTVAGGVHPDGHRYIKIDGRLYAAHRLAWLYVHGEWPTQQIDHRNGQPDDNRLANLRLATNAENQHNVSSPRANNTSGHLGVTHHRRDGWRARITIAGRRRWLGAFPTAEEASARYLEAKRELHPFWASGRGAT
jgi:hypothetical protein